MKKPANTFRSFVVSLSVACLLVPNTVLAGGHGGGMGRWNERLQQLSEPYLSRSVDDSDELQKRLPAIALGE